MTKDHPPSPYRRSSPQLNRQAPREASDKDAHKERGGSQTAAPSCEVRLRGLALRSGRFLLGEDGAERLRELLEHLIDGPHLVPLQDDLVLDLAVQRDAVAADP